MSIISLSRFYDKNSPLDTDESENVNSGIDLLSYIKFYVSYSFQN